MLPYKYIATATSLYLSLLPPLHFISLSLSLSFVNNRHFNFFNIELNNFGGLENIETDIDNGTPIASTHDNGRKRKLQIRKRDGAAVRLSKQLDRLCQAVESIPSIAIRNGENGCSIAEVMEVLHSMPEIEIKSELYLNATKIFLKK